MVSLTVSVVFSEANCSSTSLSFFFESSSPPPLPLAPNAFIGTQTEKYVNNDLFTFTKLLRPCPSILLKANELIIFGVSLAGFKFNRSSRLKNSKGLISLQNDDVSEERAK